MPDRNTNPKRSKKPHIQRDEQRLLTLLKNSGPMTATAMRQILDITEGHRAYLVLSLERQGKLHRRKNSARGGVTINAGPGQGRPDLLVDVEADEQHRDYAMKRTQIAPGHTRVQFGTHYRVGRGQRHPTAGQGGASSLVTVYE